MIKGVWQPCLCNALLIISLHNIDLCNTIDYIDYFWLALKFIKMSDFTWGKSCSSNNAYFIIHLAESVVGGDVTVKYQV